MLKKAKSSRVILGIDPGFDRVGWAVGKKTGSKIEVLDFGLIQTDKNQTLIERYQQIQTKLKVIIEQHHPQVAGLEKLFFSKNVSTAMRVAEARGILLASLIDKGVEIIELSPQVIKLAATGYGRADKAAISKMIQLQLKIPTQNLVDDTVDALAILLAIPKTT